MFYPQQIKEALKHVRYPDKKDDIVESGILRDDIRIDDFTVSFSLQATKANDPFIASVSQASERAIHKYVDPGIKVNITIIAPPPISTEKHRIAKHVIGVHSGKGGVGKSTISTNLAVTLAQQGYSVGLVDADIHGPSLPKMLQCEDYQPISVEQDGKTLIEPVTRYGVKLLSLGFFITSDQAIVWRGAMASNAIRQLLNEGNWNMPDFMIVDLPPGTSDIHLTVLQSTIVDGIIIVTSPQPVALVDAQRSIDMFQNDKLHIPILGVVENMSWFTPAELPDNRYYIFGKDGGKILAEQHNLSLLGQIPLIQSIRESGDSGQPIVLHNDDTANLFQNITCHLLSQLEI